MKTHFYIISAIPLLGVCGCSLMDQGEISNIDCYVRKEHVSEKQLENLSRELGTEYILLRDMLFSSKERGTYSLSNFGTSASAPEDVEEYLTGRWAYSGYLKAGTVLESSYFASYKDHEWGVAIDWQGCVLKIVSGEHSGKLVRPTGSAFAITGGDLLKNIPLESYFSAKKKVAEQVAASDR